jgi:hypothetical protein
MDETYKIAITRLGDRIRVGGTAEIAGYNLDLRKERRDTLSSPSTIYSRVVAMSVRQNSGLVCGR